jgi:hypothetical protein
MVALSIKDDRMCSAHLVSSFSWAEELLLATPTIPRIGKKHKEPRLGLGVKYRNTPFSCSVVPPCFRLCTPQCTGAASSGLSHMTRADAI